jgi:small nuclear ribonucleoprotein (snRNP)-like protein
MAIHSILRRFFEGSHVQVKLRDGTVIEGKLLRIDGNLKHNGLGNLILEGPVLIRGSSIQHIALRRKKQ